MAVPFSYEQAQNTRLAWTPGGGPNGTLHIVWEWRQPETLTAYADVGYIRSTDGGANWSKPRSIADDRRENYNGKFLPELSVAPNSRLDAAWWDTRDDPGIRSNDVYYAYSEDDGVTWSKNYRVSDQTIDRRYGVWGNNFDQNSPPDPPCRGLGRQTGLGSSGSSRVSHQAASRRPSGATESMGRNLPLRSLGSSSAMLRGLLQFLPPSVERT